MSWLLDTVPSSERTALEAALEASSVLSLPAGSSLPSDRFEAVSMLLVEDGLLLVSASHPGSSRRIVVSMAGSESILLPPRATERLEALADAAFTLIPTGASRRLLQIPAAALAIVDGVTDGVRDCRQSLAHLTNPRHTERVRLKLTQLARVYGKVGTDGLLLDLPLTHELLAEMVGSTRETVTRALAQLAREGIIRHERGRYHLAVPPAAAAT